MYRIVEYSDEYEKIWDNFVLNQSVNGTFLQTRNFINYHPKGRFLDGSLIIFQKTCVVSVVPACILKTDQGNELYSHKGATFGGIIVKKDCYKTEKLLEIVKALDEYFLKRYYKVTLKITPDLFSLEKSDLLQYILQYQGYNEYNELNTYIDLQHTSEDVTYEFDRNKLRNIRKCEENFLLFRELENDNEIEAFYELLQINLSKYNLHPIHTIDEIKDFKHMRIPRNVKFYGVFKGNMQVAGGMLFIFEQSKVIHAQNLSADYRFTEYSPITYLYYKVIEQAKKDNFKALSWGISMEDCGNIINWGLVRNKESYGSKHQLNRTFYKLFETEV